MASQEKASSRPSSKRESTRGKNGYYVRRMIKTNKNIISNLERHVEKHPRDLLAKNALYELKMKRADQKIR